jgi:hypothetical protein
MCQQEGTADAKNCDIMQPKLALGTTNNEVIPTGLAGPYALYRITVRVDGPNNSVAFVQAMIRDDGAGT